MGLPHILRSKNGDFREAGKVGCIEGQQAAYAMRLHDRHYPRIMNLLTLPYSLSS